MRDNRSVTLQEPEGRRKGCGGGGERSHGKEVSGWRSGWRNSSQNSFSSQILSSLIQLQRTSSKHLSSGAR